MNTFQTLFISCANKRYYHFVAPFIYSVFKTQDNCAIEIFVDEKDDIESEIGESIQFIKNNVSSDFKLTPVEFNKGVAPNTIRFIKPPTLKAEYVYISDVDIFYMDENITYTHLNFMKQTGQDFSNIMRPNSNRMTGLHFSKWDSYYPIPEDRDKSFDGRSDEVSLYNIVRLKTKREPNRLLDNKYRPVHGIHTSPNRSIDGKMNWGISLPHARKWEHMSSTKEWQEFYTTLDPKFQEISKMIDTFIKRKFPA